MGCNIKKSRHYAWKVTAQGISLGKTGHAGKSKKNMKED